MLKGLWPIRNKELYLENIATSSCGGSKNWRKCKVDISQQMNYKWQRLISSAGPLWTWQRFCTPGSCVRSGPELHSNTEIITHCVICDMLGEGLYKYLFTLQRLLMYVNIDILILHSTSLLPFKTQNLPAQANTSFFTNEQKQHKEKKEIRGRHKTSKRKEQMK